MGTTEPDGGAAPVVRRRPAGPGPGGPGGPGSRDTILGLPARYAVAIGATLVAVLVLVLASVLGGGSADDEVVVTTTVTTAPPPPVGGPPRTIEVQPDWYRKGYSLYSERGPTPTVSSLPPTTLDEDDDEDGSGTGTGTGTGSGSSGRSG